MDDRVMIFPNQYDGMNGTARAAMRFRAHPIGRYMMGLLAKVKSMMEVESPPPVAVDPGALSEAQLRTCHAAGLKVRTVLEQLAGEGRTVIEAVMNGNEFEHWQMYPWQGGILDQRNHSQYFYHAHDDYKGEHGHFHTFYYQKRKLVHLVAIGMDARGRVNKLYTFNRWGPGDTYFPAGKLKGFLPKFRIGPQNGMDARVHTFVNNLLVLFQPEIEHLCDERDATFERYRQQHNGASPYEDRDLEITSALPVELEAQIGRLEAELQRRGRSEQAATGGGTGGGAGEGSESEGMGGRDDLAAGAGADPKAEGVHLPMAERDAGHLKRSHEAGRAVLDYTRRLSEQGRSVLDVILNEKELEEWAMYPWDGGVIDKKTRSQYFYHAHPQSPEHGHFHPFYSHRNQIVHLVAISLDDQGHPMELFTVNRWVTGDFYIPANKLAGYITQFRITNNSFDREMGAYVRNLMILYQAEIETLMHQRERVFSDYRATHDGREPYEDRDLDVTSNLEIQVENQVAALERELRRRGELKE